MQSQFSPVYLITYQIDLKHLDAEPGNNSVEIGIDLMEYYPSVEWDIMAVPAVRNEKYYPCCVEPYPGICCFLCYS